MTTPDHRLRSLDAVEPADAWTDISARAAGPIDLPLEVETGSRRRPALVVAAAILVLATMAGVAALAVRSNDVGRPVASIGDAPTTIGEVAARPSPGAADGFWGRRWTVLERFDAGGAALPVVDGFRGATPVLDSRDEGTISLAGGCYGTAANVTLTGMGLPVGRLTITETLPQAAIKLPCTDEQLAQDEWFGALLAEGPTVSVRGARLTLTTDSGRRVELMDIEDSVSGTATTTMPPGVTEPLPPAEPGPPPGPETAPDLNTSSDPSGSTGSPVLPETPSAPVGTTTTLASEQSDGKFLGHHWLVERIDVADRSGPGFAGAMVDASRPGLVTVTGCNGAGGGMRLDGDRLRVDGDWFHTAMGCMSTDGTDRSMEQDAWFERFLQTEPKVAVSDSGRTATLTTSDATVLLRLPTTR